jgi:hypothetical protein
LVAVGTQEVRTHRKPHGEAKGPDDDADPYGDASLGLACASVCPAVRTPSVHQQYKGCDAGGEPFVDRAVLAHCRSPQRSHLDEEAENEHHRGNRQYDGAGEWRGLRVADGSGDRDPDATEREAKALRPTFDGVELSEHCLSPTRPTAIHLARCERDETLPHIALWPRHVLLPAT